MNKEFVLAEAWLCLHCMQREKPGKGDPSKILLERRCNIGSGSQLLCALPGDGGAAPFSCYQVFPHYYVSNQDSVGPERKNVGWKRELSADGSEQPQSPPSRPALNLPLKHPCISPLLGSPSTTAGPRPP